MSAETLTVEATPTAAMIRTLGLIAAICGFIIVAAYQGTYDAVQENKRIAVERAVFKVIPTAKSIVEFLALPDGTLAKVGAGGTANAGSAANTGTANAGSAANTGTANVPAGTVKFFAGYDENGKLAGIAAEGGAKGYADTVRILFAWDPARETVTGFGVVSSRETPGIGDKITVDKDFLANFPLDAKLAEGKLAHEIRAIKHGTKTNPWEVDAIAGATITSRAVAKAINDTAQTLLPRIVPHLASLKEKS